MLPAQVCT